MTTPTDGPPDPWTPNPTPQPRYGQNPGHPEYGQGQPSQPSQPGQPGYGQNSHPGQPEYGQGQPGQPGQGQPGQPGQGQPGQPGQGQSGQPGQPAQPAQGQPGQGQPGQGSQPGQYGQPQPGPGGQYGQPQPTQGPYAQPGPYGPPGGPTPPGGQPPYGQPPNPGPYGQFPGSPYNSTPTKSRRPVLIIVGGVVAAAVAGLIALGALLGSGEPRDTVDSFMAALKSKDIDKAHSLLCKDGREKETKESLSRDFDLDDRSITNYTLGTERKHKRDGDDETLVPVTIEFDKGEQGRLELGVTDNGRKICSLNPPGES